MAGGSRGPGLRERKRELLRRSIEEAAAAVFDERGVDGARIAEIARRAVVSEATLYNHYANKSALADGWVRRRLQGAAGDAVGADDVGGPGGPGGAGGSSGSAARAGVRQQSRDIAAAVARESLRTRAALGSVWGRSGRTAECPEPPRAPAELVGWLRAAQARDELRSDVPAEEIADLLWAAVEQRIRAWLARPRPDGEGAGEGDREDVPDDLEGGLRRAIGVVLDGSRKRHERVRAPAATRSRPDL